MKNRSFEGFETWLNAFKMQYKMHTLIFFFLSAIILCIFILSVCFTYSHRSEATVRWIAAKAFDSFYPKFKMTFKYSDGRRERISAASIARTPWIAKMAKDELKSRLISLLKISSVFLLYPFIVNIFRRRSSKQSDKKHLRGAKFDEKWEYNKQASKRKERLDIPFGSIKQPVFAEPKHSFIVGRPGTGKTVCMNGIINRVIQRKEKGIIYDNKGDYLAKFYNPETDLIFNPLDARSLGWNIFNELKTIMDADAVAASLIPGNPKENPFWANAARSVFSGMLKNLYQYGKRSNQHVWEIIIEEAKKIVDELKSGRQEGHRFIENPDSNQTLGVLAKLMEHARCFNYMKENDGDFSTDRWVKDGLPGMIFITNYADTRDTLKPVLTLFIDMICRRLLSLPDSHDRRLFMFLDEFNTLQRMTSILDMLTLSRSKGGCVYICVQDYGKIDSIYSRELRQSIVNACSTSVIFALADEAAKIASQSIGDAQYMEANRTFNMGVKNWRDGISINERREKEALVYPAEIEGIKDMQGIVKFPNYNRIITHWWDVKDRKRPKHIFPDRNTHFELRDDLLIDNVTSGEQEIIDQLEGDLNINFEKA